MSPDSYEKRPPLGDLIAPRLRVLIVAINPSTRSAGIGYSFSSPSNPFWRLLHESGLTPVQLQPCEEHRLLDHGIGLVSTVLRPTATAAELTSAERRAGAARVCTLVERHEPQVVALLGTPDQIDKAVGGLQVEVYKVKDAEPLVGAGCIYDDDRRLAGQTFIFRGEMGRDASARMQQLGFVVTEVKEDTFRLLGKDDDTGHPLVVHIGYNNGLTVVTTFAKDFYDRRAGK